MLVVPIILPIPPIQPSVFGAFERTWPQLICTPTTPAIIIIIVSSCYKSTLTQLLPELAMTQGIQLQGAILSFSSGRVRDWKLSELEMERGGSSPALRV